MATLTRGQALALIDVADDNGVVRALAYLWQSPARDADALRDFVDEHCVDGDAIRSYGPSDSDETDLPDVSL